MIWIWFLAFVVCEASDFVYYHEKSQRIFSVASTPEDNFGFSVSSMSRGLGSRLVVGAPLASNNGEIYTCDLTNNNVNNCTNVKHAIQRYPSDKEEYKNQKYWFGATVLGTDNFLVGCAPRSIAVKLILNNTNEAGTFAQCFLYNDPKEEPITLSILSNSERKKGLIHYEEGMDTFGWSLYIDETQDIWIGGPALISGRVVKMKSSSKKLYYGVGSTFNTTFNFGYSVASGLFYESLDKPAIAVGSTYGFDGHGTVSFLSVKSKKMADFKDSLVDDSVGSMFGAVLCPAHLTDSQLTDLLVGAPTFAGNEYNAGAVYVYIAKDETLPTLRKKIVGAKSQSYFGNAIVNLGDLNSDGLDDIAIGAPYEGGGRGAVYLYSGADLAREGRVDDKVPYLQKILPEPPLRTFGYSLTAIKDYDDNGCNELAIGAPENNIVTVLRCIADITIVELNLLMKHVPGTDKGLDKTEEIPMCMTLKFANKPSVVITDIVVKVAIGHHDGANLKEPADGVFNFNIYHNDTNLLKKICKNITLLISGTKGNFNKEVEYTLTATLKNDITKQDNIQSSDVILNKNSVLIQTDSLWVQECGNRLCEPNLNLTTTFSQKSPYALGSSPSIDVTVLVVNSGEVAYDACVRVAVTGASVPRPPDTCRALNESGDGRLECRPRQLIRKTSLPWSLELISVDTSQLTNKDTSIAVDVKLYSVCSSQTVTKQDSKVYQLLADSESVDIHGRTDEGLEDNVYLSLSDIAAHKTFEHIYSISNNGLTKWVDVKITVNVQKQDYITIRSVYLDTQKCELENGTESSSTAVYSCLALEINRDAGIEVKVLMSAVQGEINGKLGKEKLTVHSDAEVVLGEAKKSDSVTSELIFVEGKIPVWIIIVACILALIVLLLIFLILRKYGFLRRKNKEELERMKKSVRRQTIIRQRQSTMSRPQSKNEEIAIKDGEFALSQENGEMQKDRRIVIKDTKQE